jgi:hypothetical protein
VDKEIVEALAMEPLALLKIAPVVVVAQEQLVRRVGVLLAILAALAVMEPHRPSQAHL